MSNEHQYGGVSRPAETPDGGRQTPQQAAITGQGGAGKTDADRNARWQDDGGEPGRSPMAGRAPVAIGGSSQGQSDQIDGREPAGAKIAGGLSRSERTGGGADADVPSPKSGRDLD